MLRFTTAGESHGPALVSILEGMPAGMLTLIVVSLLTAPPGRSVQEMVENVRYPVLDDEARQGA